MIEQPPVVQFLPTWAILFLVWTNGIFITAIGALVYGIIREKQIGAMIAAVSAAAHDEVTGARAALETMIRKETADRAAEIAMFKADRAQAIKSYDERIERVEGEVFGRTGRPGGLIAETQGIRQSVGAFISLAVRKAQQWGLDAEDVRELEAHR